jgi:predicted nucleic acid-binding protein
VIVSEQGIPSEFVLDTSVAVKFFLPEVMREEALRLLSAVEIGEVKLLAPSTLQPEFFNALWQQHRRGMLSRMEVYACWNILSATPIDLYAPEDLMPRAVQIALETNVIIYDALFLALAEDADTIVVNADDKLVNALLSSNYTKLARHLSAIGDLPG